MPIHLKILNPRQAEAGKIKIGRLGEEREKKNRPGEKYQLPEKLDHFILTKTERGDDGNFIVDEELMAMLPKDDDGKIRKIPILLSSDDLDEVFPHTLAAYHGRNLLCRGDGEEATRYEIKTERRDGRNVKIKTGRSKTRKCPCELLGAEEGIKCKPHGTLWATIVAGAQTKIGARHSFRTTSWDSVSSIKAGLEEIQRMIGTLVGPPLHMYVRPRRVKPKGEGSKIVYVVHVDCTSKDIQELRERVLAQAQMRHNIAAVAGRPIRLGLPRPAVNESAGEQARIQQEYHPEVPEEDDDPEYDPVTGEVYDDGAIDTEAWNSDGGWESNPKPEEESQDAPPVEEQKFLGDDHPTRIRAKELLTEIARARDFSDADLKKARAAIWREACKRAEYEGLPWAELNLHRWKRIGPALETLLKRHDEDAEI